MSYRAAALALFQRQYFQLLEPERLAWPEQHELRLPEIQVWIYEHIFDNELIQYPPPERYQLRVLKQLMARIEECIIDPDKDVGYTLCSCSPSCSLLEMIYNSTLII